MSLKYKKLKKYFPAEILYSHFHNTKSVFLDSSLKNKYGKYSVIGLYPYLEVKESNNILKINDKETKGNLLDFLDSYIKENKQENNTELPIISGAIGYLTYDYGRKFESISSKHNKEVNIPDALFTFYDLYIIEDLEKREIYISTQEKFNSIENYENKIENILNKNNISSDENTICNITSNFNKNEYLNAVESMRNFIKTGDIYIANMTRQIKIESNRKPYDIFCYLRKHNPSPFGGYFNDGNFQIVSASPERFLEVRNGIVETRPIKGTRKRGATPKEDILLKKELENSEKDKSELLMIVDLERNDLNRVCKAGSVKVSELFDVEEYATVFHLVSTVRGELKEDKTVIDLLKSTFPGGSITGAPKIRAMEIIDKLEHSQRGLYTGSMGYLALNGDCDLNIVIRTLVHKNGTYNLGVGGGITYESNPEFEYEETEQKAIALIDAITGGKTDEQ